MSALQCVECCRWVELRLKEERREVAIARAEWLLMEEFG